MFWKPRKSSIIIPVELHEKLARTSQRIEETDSEVLCVRSAPLVRGARPDNEAARRNALRSALAEEANSLDSVGYEGRWQWHW